MKICRYPGSKISAREMNKLACMAASLWLACLHPVRTAAEECAQPRVDVAGHLTIAANTDPHALRDRWRWGAVPVGIAVRKDGAVYWAEYRSGAIKRTSGDGEHVESIATVDGPLGIALDDARDELFYVTDRHYPRTVGRLRADGPTSLVCGADLNRPFAIAVGKDGARIYWT